MSRNPFQGGMGFFTRDGSSVELDTSDAVAIPFRVGWGFSPDRVGLDVDEDVRVAIPFRVGWGFSLVANAFPEEVAEPSQSLSGWDGVFHRQSSLWLIGELAAKSQSLSGWDGVFHSRTRGPSPTRARAVAIPFRVGWGFSQRCGLLRTTRRWTWSQSLSGWDGVFHVSYWDKKITQLNLSQSLSGWDGVFHWARVREVRISYFLSQSLSGWDGVFHES